MGAVDADALSVRQTAHVLPVDLRKQWYEEIAEMPVSEDARQNLIYVNNEYKNT